MTASKPPPVITVNPMQVTTLTELLNNPRARKYVLIALRHQMKEQAAKDVKPSI